MCTLARAVLASSARNRALSAPNRNSRPCGPLTSPRALELTAGDVGSVLAASNVTTISEDVDGICVGAEVVNAIVVNAVVVVARPRLRSFP